MPNYNQPSRGVTNWDVPLNANFDDLGIEVTDEVQSWGDLPDTSEVEQSSHSQWPVYRVTDDSVFVKVTDSTKNIIGGLGSDSHPLPEVLLTKLTLMN